MLSSNKKPLRQVKHFQKEEKGKKIKYGSKKGNSMEDKKKILIVEDEASIAELEKDYLELSGFQVETEGDGEKG